MKKLSKKEGIAVFASIAFVTYILYGASVLDIFRSDRGEEQARAQSLPQSGVRVQDIQIGSGPLAAPGDQLTVHYVGALPDGRVFDSSVDRNLPYAFTLSTTNVIRGWAEGLVGMREGGVRRLIIAPDYAYGSQQVGSVPANSTLIFEVQLLDVQKPQE